MPPKNVQIEKQKNIRLFIIRSSTTLKTLGLTDKNCQSSKLASIKLIKRPESRDMQLTRREGAHERQEFQKMILTHVCLHAASSKSDDSHGPKH